MGLYKKTDALSNLFFPNVKIIGGRCMLQVCFLYFG
jgi:hypothetical protein